MADIVHKHYWLQADDMPEAVANENAYGVRIGSHPEGKSIGYICIPDPAPEGDAKWIASADGEDIGEAWLTRYFMTKDDGADHVIVFHLNQLAAQKGEAEKALNELRWR
jgi:hypothetical protein